MRTSPSAFAVAVALALPVAAFSLALPSRAEAAAFLVTTPTGVSAGDAGKLEKEIKTSLKSAGHKIVKSSVSLDDSAAAIGCAPGAADCIARIAGAAGAEYVLVPVATPETGKSLRVRIRVHRGADGADLGEADVTVASASADADYGGIVEAALEPRDRLLPAGSGAGASGTEAVAPKPDPGPDAGGGPMDRPAARPIGKIHYATIGVGGGAVVLLGFGIYFAVRVGMLQNEFDDTPLTTDAGRRDARILASKGKTSSAAAAAFLTAGSLAAAAAAFLVADNLWLGVIFRRGDGGDRVGLALSGSF